MGGVKASPEPVRRVFDMFVCRPSAIWMTRFSNQRICWPSLLRSPLLRCHILPSPLSSISFVRRQAAVDQPSSSADMWTSRKSFYPPASPPNTGFQSHLEYWNSTAVEVWQTDFGCLYYFTSWTNIYQASLPLVKGQRPTWIYVCNLLKSCECENIKYRNATFILQFNSPLILIIVD